MAPRLYTLVYGFINICKCERHIFHFFLDEWRIHSSIIFLLPISQGRSHGKQAKPNTWKPMKLVWQQAIWNMPWQICISIPIQQSIAVKMWQCFAKISLCMPSVPIRSTNFLRGGLYVFWYAFPVLLWMHFVVKSMISHVTTFSIHSTNSHTT